MPVMWVMVVEEQEWKSVMERIMIAVKENLFKVDGLVGCW